MYRKDCLQDMCASQMVEKVIDFEGQDEVLDVHNHRDGGCQG